MVMPLRKFPICLKEDLRRELDRLEESGVLQKGMEPTKWVSSMVIERKKDGSMCLCIDPKHLNKALLQPRYPLPVIDNILPELAGARVFSVADARNGFWHVRPDEKSSLLTTMAPPFGRFRWTRMPFGISPAPEIFQQKLGEALAGLAGVRPVADDILVYGEGKTLETAVENHDERFLALLEHSQETGLRLHRRKLKHRLSEVPYVGHLSDQGLKVHPPKVAAVVKMPDPDNVSAVKRFIGMATYLSRYQTSQAVLSHCDSFSQRTAHGLGP